MKRYWKYFKPDGYKDNEPYWYGPGDNKIFNFKEWLIDDEIFWKEHKNLPKPYNCSPNPLDGFAYDENGNIYSKHLQYLKEQKQRLK